MTLPSSHPIRTEYKIAFPFLYNNRPRKVALAKYQEVQNCFVKADDPDLPAYYYDPIINPITLDAKSGLTTAEKSLEQQNEEKFISDLLDPEDGFDLPETVNPLLESVPLFTDDTAAGMSLYWAPAPFNQRSGKTRRAQDVPLVMSW